MMPMYSPQAYIENLVREAYANWNSLEEVDGLLTDTPLLLTQGSFFFFVSFEYNLKLVTRNRIQSFGILLGDKGILP